MDKCVIWPYAVIKSGYGMITIVNPETGRKTTTTAHRLARALWDPREDDVGLQVAHDPVNCTSRACINPLHTRWSDVELNHMDTVLAMLLRLEVMEPEDATMYRNRAYAALDGLELVPTRVEIRKPTKDADPAALEILGPLYAAWKDTPRAVAHDARDAFAAELLKAVDAGDSYAAIAAGLGLSVGSIHYAARTLEQHLSEISL